MSCSSAEILEEERLGMIVFTSTGDGVSSAEKRLKRHDICIITTIHEPYDVRIYQRELQTLVEAGFSVCLVSAWERPPDRLPCAGWISLPMPRSRWGRLRHGARTFLAAFRVESRSYLFHDLDFVPWAVLLRWLKRVPVVYDCHENYHEEILHGKEWIPRPFRCSLAAAVRIAEGWAVRRFDAVLAVTPHQIRRFHRAGARCVMVRNFASWGARPDVPHEPGLLHSGSLSENYGVNILLGIARELKRRAQPLPLVVADRFGADQRLRRLFLEIVEREGLPVRLEPEVLPMHIDQLLSKGCIGLSVAQNSPSKQHGYPTKIFEYMAMGMPVVASDLELTREVVETAGCGVLVPPDDPKAYVDAALAILHDPSRFQLYRQNGLKASEHVFHWKFEGARLVGLFRYLLRQSDDAPWTEVTDATTAQG
ncbi:MAG TPA: glycosyltransferase family 4 protein [Clostridia bacterium]|nr:glycosyltransferase family 4 protein [Clostridia bacterium]